MTQQSDSAAPNHAASLRRTRRAAFLLLLATVAVVVSTYLGFDAQKAEIKAHAERNLADIAALKAGQIGLWLKARKDDALLFSDDAPMAKLFDDWLRGGAKDDDNRRWLIERLNTLLRARNYEALMLLDRDARVRLATPAQAAGDDPVLRELALAAMRTGQIRMNDIHIGTTGKRELDLIAPLLVGNSHRRSVGALYFRIDPERFLFPLIESWPLESTTAETLLVRRESDTVLFLNRLRHRGDAVPMSFRAPLDAPDLPAAQVLRGKTGFTSGRDYRGEKVVGYLQRIPDTDWGMVAKIDEAEIYAPVRRLALYVDLALFLATAFIAAVFWAVLRHAQYVEWQYGTERTNRLLAQRFEYLTKSANDIIMLSDDAGRYLDVNDRAVEAYGYTRDELLQMHVGDLRTPEAMVTRDHDWRELLEHGQARFDTVHRRKDGSLLHVEISGRLIDIGDQRFVQTIIRDISERVQRHVEQVDHRQRIQELGHRLIAAQEDERRKLGSALHDRTAANLAAMDMMLSSVARNLPAASDIATHQMEDIRALMADTTATIRDIVADLRPPLLDYLGLAPALEAYGQQFARHTGIPTRVCATERRLPAGVESALYRIVQEALTNCAKHAAATAIEIELADSGDHIALTIADDGVGFAAATLEHTPGLGLLIMRERAEFAGGSFGLETAPGRGTKIRIEVPHDAGILPA